MRRLFPISLLIAVASGMVLPPVAQAQFGLFRDVGKGATASTTDAKCASGKKSRGGNILGSVFGGVASRTAGKLPMASYLPVAKFSDTLTDAIACKLDPQEQEKAATATDAVIKKAERSSGPTTTSWTSDTRADVSGTSTVESKTKTADGSSCMNVTDVVIVEGEETRVSKKMCRSPGQSRYVLTA